MYELQRITMSEAWENTEKRQEYKTVNTELGNDVDDEMKDRGRWSYVSLATPRPDSCQTC